MFGLIGQIFYTTFLKKWRETVSYQKNFSAISNLEKSRQQNEDYQNRTLFKIAEVYEQIDRKDRWKVLRIGPTHLFCQSLSDPTKIDTFSHRGFYHLLLNELSPKDLVFIERKKQMTKTTTAKLLFNVGDRTHIKNKPQSEYEIIKTDNPGPYPMVASRVSDGAIWRGQTNGMTYNDGRSSTTDLVPPPCYKFIGVLGSGGFLPPADNIEDVWQQQSEEGLKLNHVMQVAADGSVKILLDT